MIQTTKSVAQLARGRALLFGLDVKTAIESELDASAGNVSPLDAEVIRGASSATLEGLGPLQNLLKDDSVEEIWINRPGEIRFADERGHHRMLVELSASEIENYVARMLRSTSRRVDRSHPFVDATLPDGSRLHVVIPNVTREHWSVNIRKFRLGQLTLTDLQRMGALSGAQVSTLVELIRAGRSLVVSGATQAGKTTLLTALLNELEPHERLVTVEDTFEINCQVADWVALQTRERSSESAQEIDLRRLVRETLRMRPTRIAVGEVRGAEALEMLIAFNSGIPGMCTMHANSGLHALQKLKTLPLLAGSNLPPQLIEQLACDNVAAIIHCERVDGVRRVKEILELSNG